MSALVVNLAAGPGAGKSTTAAFVFAYLKEAGVEVEVATEYAKDLVWAEPDGRVPPYLRDHQVLVFGEQLRRLDTLARHPKLEVVVTDSPLFLASVFAPREPEPYHLLVWAKFHDYNNHNVFVKRVKPYHAAGRLQSEDEARAVDQEVLDLLPEWDQVVPGNQAGARSVATEVLRQLGRLRPPRFVSTLT